MFSCQGRKQDFGRVGTAVSCNRTYLASQAYWARTFSQFNVTLEQNGPQVNLYSFFYLAHSYIQGETQIKKSACPSGTLLFHCASPKL